MLRVEGIRVPLSHVDGELQIHVNAAMEHMDGAVVVCVSLSLLSLCVSTLLCHIWATRPSKSGLERGFGCAPQLTWMSSIVLLSIGTVPPPRPG